MMLRETLSKFSGTQLGDPSKFASIILDVVRGEGKMIGEDGKPRDWPQRLVIGSDSANEFKETMASWTKSLEEFAEITKSTDRWEFTTL